MSNKNNKNSKKNLKLTPIKKSSSKKNIFLDINDNKITPKNNKNNDFFLITNHTSQNNNNNNLDLNNKNNNTPLDKSRTLCKINNKTIVPPINIENIENKDIKPINTDLTMKLDNLIKEKMDEIKEKRSKLIDGLDKCNTFPLTTYSNNKQNSDDLEKKPDIMSLLKNYDNDYNSIFSESSSSLNLWRNPFLDRKTLFNPDEPFRSSLQIVSKSNDTTL